ncbi:C25 family cysteine peptidase, partial [[Eubacterium] cellulosolvens]
MRNKTNSNSLQIFAVFIFIIFMFTVFHSLAFSTITASDASGADVDADGIIFGNTASARGTSRATIDREIPDSKVKYAIIAPSAFTDTLIPLVNWKTYKGVPAKIFTLESIYANYKSGRDSAENLRMFLQDLDKTSSAFEWLLLVGDADVVPIRWLHADAKSPYGLNDNYVSDYYYAGLEGTWDKNNDNVYGDGTADGSLKFEGDWTPEVYVGRLPVANVTDLVGCVNDILDYETNPDIGLWMTRVVMWGGLMDAPNVPKYKPYDTNAYKAKELYVKPIIKDKASHMSIITRYDYSQLAGGSYSSGTDELYRYGAGGAVPDLNNGASLINFAGQ